MDELLEFIPMCFQNNELQAVLLLGFTCVGIWVVISWTIQLMFSVVWPFILVVTALYLLPNWRKIITDEILPKYKNSIKSFAQKAFANYNSTQKIENIQPATENGLKEKRLSMSTIKSKWRALKESMSDMKINLELALQRIRTTPFVMKKSLLKCTILDDIMKS